MTEAQLTVGIPADNRPRLLGEALKSLCDQTQTPHLSFLSHDDPADFASDRLGLCVLRVPAHPPLGGIIPDAAEYRGVVELDWAIEMAVAPQ